MSASSAHIAGVGVSQDTTGPIAETAALQAAVKALLDAGATYGEVDHSVACSVDDQLRIPPKCFDTLGMKGAAVSIVDNNSGLFTAVQYIKSGQANCVLVLGIDMELSSTSNKVAAVATVLVSDQFLNSHAYLRDSAICISACCLKSQMYSRRSGGSNGARTSRTIVQTALRQADLVPKYVQLVEVRGGRGAGKALEDFRNPRSQSPTSLNFSGVSGWLGLCGIVWQLRGWAHDAPVSQAKNCLLYTSNADAASSVIILCRSDGRVAPAWKDVKNVREGRERLGYNPATETRGISNEDLEDVRAPEEFTSSDSARQLELPIKGGDRAALARL